MAGAVVLAFWVLWPRPVPKEAPPPLPSPSPSPSPLGSPLPLPVAPVALRTVEGRVLDGAGQPVAGARVEVLEQAPPTPAEPAGELGILRGPIPYPPVEPANFGPSTVSDGAGRFRLGGLRAGLLRLSASHPQFSRKTVEVSGTAVDLVLEPAPPMDPLTDPSMEPALAAQPGNQRLAGVVVDDRGFPVAGARVDTAGHTAVSDVAGRFELLGLPAGPFHVRVAHADFAPSELTTSGEEARLQLFPGGGIEGELRDAHNGRQPAGTVLELLFDGRRQTVPLHDGRFQVSGLRAGRVALAARAPGYVPLRQEVEVPAGDRPREVTVRDLRLELERGGVIAGSLRSEDGDPAAAAQVWAGAANCRTDSRGEFRLEGVAAGRVRVTASHGGRRAAEDVEVRADEESRVELTLR